MESKFDSLGGIPEENESIEDLAGPTFQVNPDTKLSKDYINSFSLLTVGLSALNNIRSVPDEFIKEVEDRIEVAFNNSVPTYEEHFKKKAEGFPSEEDKLKFAKLVRIAPKDRLARLNELADEVNIERVVLLEKFRFGEREEIIARLQEIRQKLNQILSSF